VKAVESCSSVYAANKRFQADRLRRENAGAMGVKFAVCGRGGLAYHGGG